MKRRNEFDQHISTLSRLHRRRHAIVIGALLLAALAVGMTGKFRSAKAADTAQPSGPAMVRQGDKLTVPANSPLRSRLAVQTVGVAGVGHALALPGVVEADPARTVNILPPLTGRLAELKVALGDTVTQGQLLAVVRSPDLDQAWADAEKARDALDLAHKALERARGVHEAGANAVKDYEQANSNYEQALAEAKRAEARLATLNGGRSGNTSRLLEITAPVAGTVTALNGGTGTYLNDPTAALMTISNLDRVWVTANVPEDQLASIAKGQAADVQLAAYPGQIFHGAVSFVSAMLEPDTHRNKVRIAFANVDGKLKPNMYASVSFALPQTAQGSQLSVPASALLMNNDSTTVFVETAPWTFERRTVELGQEDGADSGAESNATVRILSGLKAGERIVVRGGVLLND